MEGDNISFTQSDIQSTNELVNISNHESSEESLENKLEDSEIYYQTFPQNQNVGSLSDTSVSISNGENLCVPKDNVQLSCHQLLCNENVERKQYSEREITYNLLLRKMVDDFLDRTVTYSHQPKHVLAVLKCILERNFPEFGDSFHRERICAYLKACRRNAKKKNGEPFVRMSARYLSAGMATRLANQIYAKEYKLLAKIATKRTPKFGSALNSTEKISVNPNEDTVNSQNQIDSREYPIENSNVNLVESVNLMQPGMAECAFAKLLEQTAEFLILVADRLDSGQLLFPYTTLNK